MHFTHLAYAAYLDVMQGDAAPAHRTPFFIFADHHNFQRIVIDNLLYTERLRRRISLSLGHHKRNDFQFSHQTCSVGLCEYGTIKALKQFLKVGLFCAAAKVHSLHHMSSVCQMSSIRMVCYIMESGRVSPT